MDSSSRDLLAIIPAFNEEGSVGNVIDEIRWYVPKADVVIIDDGSSDSTADIARARGAYVVSLPFNCGIGTAMQTGYLYAQRHGYDIAVQIDGDGQHDPGQLDYILKPILESKADMVIGSRFLGIGTGGYTSTAARRIGIAWLASIVSWMTGSKITDPTSGFRAANRKVIEHFANDYPSDYPEPEVIVPLRKKGFVIAEVPVVMRQRQAGQSSITALRSIYYMIKVTLALMVGLFRVQGRR